MKDFDIFDNFLEAMKKKESLENVCMNCIPPNTAKPKKWIVKLCKKCGKHGFCH